MLFFLAKAIIDNDELMNSCRMDGNNTHCYFELGTTYFSPIEAWSMCPNGTHLTTITSQEELDFVFSLKCKFNNYGYFLFQSIRSQYSGNA